MVQDNPTPSPASEVFPQVEFSPVNVTGSNFEITFVSGKHVVEDDVLFTNHLVGK